ncbi:hypothetical protein [Steroidobacter cummioxidans]|uniref:hypothetical protein n=1 Tax=Steroidobacter cummioxidans TaxID=1803913 RepID=UPI000E31B219|nr:hypothetical protein [Steroidobacter cummioxidans]
MKMSSLKRIALAMAAFALAPTTHAAEIGFFNLVVERVFVNSSHAQNVGHRGEVWIKINSSIDAIHATGCPANNWYNVNGYLVAAYADDVHRNQILAGLLAAKATGQPINGAVDDSKKNVSGICTLTWYEVQ